MSVNAVSRPSLMHRQSAFQSQGIQCTQGALPILGKSYSLYSLSGFFQDEASYIAGERAALLRAFRETLPSQQALGSLFHAVQHLTKQMDRDGHDVHQVYLPLSHMH